MNGRGYIILKPSQEEESVFENVESFKKLSFSLNKPNGKLLSEITDSNTVGKIEYEYYNQNYIKIVIQNFFAKNEFCVGDNVRITQFIIYKNSENPCTKTIDYEMFNTFINREEGHEIVELGQPNENGYFKTFFIAAPSTFDAVNGKTVVTKSIVDALNEFNIYSISYQSAKIINSSIQPILYATVVFEKNRVFHA